MVVVKWSACSPSPPTIRVRILLTSTVFSVKFVFEKNKIKKMLGVAHLKKSISGTLSNKFGCDHASTV